MGAVIEAPFIFLQKPIKIVLLNAVEHPHMSFGLVPEIIDPADMVAFVSEQFRVVDAQMMKIRNIKRIVGSEGVRINDTATMLSGRTFS